MNERVLLVSGNAEWCEAMAIALDHAGHTGDEPESTDPVARAHVFQPTIAVVHTDVPAANVAVGERVGAIQTITCGLREAFPDLPIILIASAPSTRLTAAAEAIGTAEVVLARGTDVASIAQAALSAAGQLRPVGEPELPSSWATIEVTLYETTLECVARAGSRISRRQSVPWSRQSIALINDNFRRFESDEDEFRIKVDEPLLADISKRLLWDLFGAPLRDARDYCDRHMQDGGTIHYRFVVGDGDLEFVPFELVATANEGQYLRAVRPLARKLIVKEEHRDPNRGLKACATNTRVLFIKADVSGALSVRNHKFKQKDSSLLKPLARLDEECREVRKLYDPEQFLLLELLPGEDNVKKINQCLRDGPFDVVHFAGHSVRSDTTTQVFLALPGREPGTIIPYDAEDFARLAAEADVGLVILSSCEGTSCRALSRMASYGVPAVAGFRWPVDDSDAAIFTPALHEELRGGGQPVPIIRAFHEALLRLKSNTAGWLSWFSPVLMVQHSEWHEFTLER
jgi:hypothetical protein